jgi:hypothetical protein
MEVLLYRLIVICISETPKKQKDVVVAGGGWQNGRTQEQAGTREKLLSRRPSLY